MTNMSAIMDGSMYYHNNLSSLYEPSAPITHDESFMRQKLRDKWHVAKDDENKEESAANVSVSSEKSSESDYSKLSLYY